MWEPFAGTATALVAPVEEERLGFGAEVVPDFFPVAAERLRETAEQAAQDAAEGARPADHVACSPRMPPRIDPEVVTEAVLALEGTTFDDLVLPLPGDLMDISKAAAMVSGVVEDRIPELLNRVRATTWDSDPNNPLGGYEFRKSPIGFPDVLLVERTNPSNVIFEIEAKSWYILSSDPLTARFETAESVITPETLVVVAAWMLDGVVSGSPKIMRLYVDWARRLAEVRDRRWTETGRDLEGVDLEAAWPGSDEPRKDHRVVQPSNPEGTPRNLRSTQVRGEVFDRSRKRWVKDAENFGKLDRLYDDDVKTFRDDVWKLEAAGKSLDAWRAFVKTSEEVDDSDLDAAQVGTLDQLTAVTEQRNALVRSAVTVGVDDSKIRRATGLTMRAIEKITEQ